MKSFFGALWKDIQVIRRVLTPYEGIIATLPGGSIVVTVLNVLAELDKIIPNTSDETRAALVAALTSSNHPTVDVEKLKASVLKLLTAVAPIGGVTGAGITSITTVEKYSPTAASEVKKKTASLMMNEILQNTVEPTVQASGIDNTVTALNEIDALVKK